MAQGNDSSLGQILVLQNLLQAAPNVRWAADALCGALIKLPSICSAAFYLGEGLFTSAHARDDSSIVWPSDYNHKNITESFPSDKVLREGLVETAKCEYGHVCLAIEDEKSFQAYFPYIENVLNTLALVIENIEQSVQLNVLTDDLENQVALQTKKINKQSTLLRRMFDEAIYGIALAEPETGLIVDCNTAFAEMVERPKRDIIGYPQRDLHPEEEQDGDLTISFKKHLGELEGQPLTTKMLTSTGRIIDVEVVAKIIEVGGKKFNQGFFKDISESKQFERELHQSEETFRILADTSPLAIYVFSGQSDKAAYINPTFTKLLGYSIEDIPNADVWYQLAYPDIEYRQHLASEWHKRLKIALKEEKPFEPMESEVSCKDGTKKVVLWNFIVSGEKHWICGLDLTEIRRGEKEKVELEKRIYQSSKFEAIGTLAGGVAHDFNNLLAIIRANVDAIRYKKNNQDDVDENLGNISDATGRGTNLVKQILAFSRQEQPELVPVDLKAVSADAIKLLRSTMPSSIEILFLSDYDEIFVEADSTQLQQVFINLCTNAAHAMGEKGLLTVRLSREVLSEVDRKAHNLFADGQYVKLAITDTGHGIDTKNLDKVFDPFFTTKAIGEGTGMGLAVVRGIVEQHNGCIIVDSTPGKGTTFNAYFPETVAGEIQPTKSAEKSLPKGSERILFVDDEEVITETYVELLQSQGYDVTGVSGSLEAVKIFTEDPDKFDLIITDQTMPDMLGTELAEKVLQIKSDMPIILCSGYSAKLNEEDVKKNGIRAFCSKPFGLGDLAVIIREIFD